MIIRWSLNKLWKQFKTQARRPMTRSAEDRESLVECHNYEGPDLDGMITKVNSETNNVSKKQKIQN